MSDEHQFVTHRLIKIVNTVVVIRVRVFSGIKGARVAEPWGGGKAGRRCGTPLLRPRVHTQHCGICRLIRFDTNGEHLGFIILILYIKLVEYSVIR